MDSEARAGDIMAGGGGGAEPAPKKIKKKFLLHSNRQLAENRHVMCVVEKAGFEPRTLGTGAERDTNCATAPVEPAPNIIHQPPGDAK